MPSVSFTLSELEDDRDAESEELLEKWRITKELHDSFCGFDYPLVVFRGSEVPKRVLHVGPWRDAREHLVEYARSQEMKEYLAELGGVLDLKGAFHLDVKWSDVPIDSKHIFVHRYWIEEEVRPRFEELFMAYLPVLRRRCGGKIAYGWTTQGGWQDIVSEDDGNRLVQLDRPSQVEDPSNDDKENGLREWVCVVGWKDEQSMMKSREEMARPLSGRQPTWYQMREIISLSRKMTGHNFQRVDYLQHAG